jgi:hypothetical protein
VIEFPTRAEDQVVWAAWGGGVVLALIVLYLFAPDIIAGVVALKNKLVARNERILREREARANGHAAGGDPS